MSNHAKLLAEKIPPLSSAVGGMPLDKLSGGVKTKQFDQMDFRDTELWDSSNRPGKSRDQQRNKQWLHGDYKDAPFLLTHKLYEKIKDISK